MRRTGSRGGARVVRGRFGRKRPRAPGPQAFDDWRSPDEPVADDRLEALERDLAPILLIAEPRWSEASHGDPGAAIAVALNRLWIKPPADIRRDLILAALWGCASAGDPASKLLLRVLRERIGEREKR